MIVFWKILTFTFTFFCLWLIRSHQVLKHIGISFLKTHMFLFDTQERFKHCSIFRPITGQRSCSFVENCWFQAGVLFVAYFATRDNCCGNRHRGDGQRQNDLEYEKCHWNKTIKTYIDRVRLKQTNYNIFQAIIPSIFYPLLTLPMTNLVKC